MSSGSASAGSASSITVFSSFFPSKRVSSQAAPSRTVSGHPSAYAIPEFPSVPSDSSNPFFEASSFSDCFFRMSPFVFITAKYICTGDGIAAKIGLSFSFKNAPTCRGPSAVSTFPSSMTTTRSEAWKISSSRCSVIRTVVRSSRLILRTVFKKSESAIGSSWLVGSSKISTSGCIAIIEARFNSCFCPPDSSVTFL